ncbi:hypothetical protein Y032_0016g3115 [Ancylostoma ceylanicum]|uniref:SCP domain-containing protein n=1 Tax=Ancylostoma ceylanicum TaxID=53326 RepID=A0A016V7W9_9BILA|nr:hypothetical protein Y032_0016g3115 [Ancylostoma ceylanicum]
MCGSKISSPVKWKTEVQKWPENGKRKTENLKFLEMSWHHTNRVGCATHACQGVKIIICKYAPPGRIIDQHIYTPGRPCQYCPGQCNTQLGLCTN